MTSAEFIAIRKNLGFSQTALAGEMGVSMRTIQALESKPEVPAVYSLALERIALSFAAQAGLITLAPTSVRSDALALAKAIVG